MALGDKYRTIKSTSGANKYGIEPGETFASLSKKKERASVTGGGINFYNTTPVMASRSTLKTRKSSDDYVPVLGKALRSKKE